MYSRLHNWNFNRGYKYYITESPFVIFDDELTFCYFFFKHNWVSHNWISLCIAGKFFPLHLCQCSIAQKIELMASFILRAHRFKNGELFPWAVLGSLDAVKDGRGIVHWRPATDAGEVANRWLFFLREMPFD
jgi:hypothetical protein